MAIMDHFIGGGGLLHEMVGCVIFLHKHIPLNVEPSLKDREATLDSPLLSLFHTVTVMHLT